MTILRMDNVAIVVEDLDAAVDFYTELGMQLENRAEIEGLFADKAVGLHGVQSEIAMMVTPDGRSKLELTAYRAPAPIFPEAPPASNTIGLHRVMFAVDDIDATIERLRPHGAELLGPEVANYENVYRLCYLRGPSGIIVALAEKIG